MIEILKEKKINMFFSDIYGSPKLKTEIINIILKNCKVNSDEVLFFGDTLTDLNAACLLQSDLVFP
jgi:3-deoxy-D-manno-octulosonate 8-phosphate phosphatase KdsC-like HAD superfamily phosphatase